MFTLKDKEAFEKFRKERTKIKCPNCGYDGGDLDIGQNPISNPMMCSECRRYFNPFAGHLQLKIETEVKEK
jgi:hypothetical protein